MEETRFSVARPHCHHKERAPHEPRVPIVRLPIMRQRSDVRNRRLSCEGEYGGQQEKPLNPSENLATFRNAIVGQRKVTQATDGLTKSSTETPEAIQGGCWKQPRFSLSAEDAIEQKQRQ
jgi:hypothetical protein